MDRLQRYFSVHIIFLLGKKDVKEENFKISIFDFSHLFCIKWIVWVWFLWGYVGYNKEGNAWSSPVDDTTRAIYVLEVLRHFLLKIKLT